MLQVFETLLWLTLLLLPPAGHPSIQPFPRGVRAGRRGDLPADMLLLLLCSRLIVLWRPLLLLLLMIVLWW